MENIYLLFEFLNVWPIAVITIIYVIIIVNVPECLRLLLELIGTIIWNNQPLVRH